MFKRWAASMLVLALCAVGSTSATAQSSSRGRIGTNYPNPLNPSTTIPFGVGEDPCKDPTQQYVVTIRIFNLLGQLEGIPILQATGAGASQSGSVGRRVEGLRLTCGSYSAFWDGKNPHTGREVASGIYVIHMYADGKLVADRRIRVSK